MTIFLEVKTLTNKIRSNSENKKTREDLWKKLKFIQEELLETKEGVVENRKKLNKLEKIASPEGGVQPNKKGLNIFEDEEGRKSFTDVGQDIYKKLRKQRHLTRNDLEDILVEHDMTRSKPTCLKYLKDIAAEINSYLEESSEDGKAIYRAGSQGGKNGGKPSRVVLNNA